MMIGITGFICWFSRFPEASKLCRMSITTISGCPTILTPSTGSLQSAGQPVYIELAAAAEPTHSLPWMSPIQLLHDGCTSHPTPINLKIPSLLFSKSHQKECLTWERQVKSFFSCLVPSCQWPWQLNKPGFLKKPATTSSEDSQASGMPLLILPLPPAEPWEGEEAPFYSKLVSETPTASTQHPSK